MTEMIQKESLSDDAFMPFNPMDKYLVNYNNLNPIALQKQVSQNMQQPNNNFNGVTDENMRNRTCYNQNFISQPQFNNGGHQFNRSPAVMNSSQMNDQLNMKMLYKISIDVPPIDKLTLSVNNGNLFGPFHLQAEQMVTEIEFSLADDSLNQINQRDDLDIVLLSRFMKGNAINLLVWPPSIKISVNDMPLSLDTTLCNKLPLHLPQFIKRNCVAGRNVVKFEMMDLSQFNHQLFQFHIYMVHRPTIAHSKKLTQENALISEDLTNKLLQRNCMALNRNHLNISKICPITEKRIEIPIRSKDCDHLQPFDLMGFLTLQARWMLNLCPICCKHIQFNFNGYQQNIVIDRILQQMFEKTPQACDMIQIDSNGAFAPLLNPGPEYMQMIAPHNNGVPRSQYHEHMMRQSAPYRYMAVEPFMASNGIQSPPGHMQYRSMVPCNNGAPTMPANRSLLDFSPCDNTNIIYTNNGSLPSQLTTVTHSPVKKPAKRKPPAKRSAPKMAIEPPIINPMAMNGANLRNHSGSNNNNNNNNCPTPPSTRTSSVASTSSPDSLNVPHSVPKRSPSLNDHLSNTILSESHLNDELLLYSAAATTTTIANHHHHNHLDPGSLPQMSSSLSFSQPANFYSPSHHHFTQQQQQQQQQSGWTINDTQLFGQQPHAAYQMPVTVAADTFSTYCNNNEEQPQQQQHQQQQQTQQQESTIIDNNHVTVTKYIDDILTNHEQVPELVDCDWLSDEVDLGNPPINGLSDLEDF